MKHQALARVFAVVLAIMCLLMLLNGATGFGKAAKAHEERTAFEEKYAQRIENYVTLHAQVENSISYDEAYEDALRAAVTAAGAKAAVLAECTGDTLGPVLSLSEGYQNTSYRYAKSNYAMAEEAAR